LLTEHLILALGVHSQPPLVQSFVIKRPPDEKKFERTPFLITVIDESGNPLAFAASSLCAERFFIRKIE